MGYLVTEYEHRVERCAGEEPRIMFMFGFCVKKTDWEAGEFVSHLLESKGKEFSWPSPRP